MHRTARIFMNNRSQAVRLPKDFQFSVGEVYIRKEGEDVVLSARPASWNAYLESGPVAPDDFMTGVHDLPVQERKSITPPATRRREAPGRGRKGTG